MARYDHEGRILYFNKLLRQALAVENEEIQGKLSTEYWPNGRYLEYETKLLECIQTGEKKILNLDVTTPENIKTHHIIQFYPEKNKDHIVIGAISYCTDITEKVTLEKQIEIDARLSMIGQLFANIAHEINNPLMAMAMKCEILEEKINKNEITNEKFKSFISEMRHHISRIENTIRSTRTVVRNSENDTFAEETLDSILEECLSVCDPKIKSSKVKVLTNKDDFKFIKIYCRKIQIEQVLINLISNACDSVKVQSDPWIEIEMFHDQDQTVISVKDSGLGIPKEVQELMTKPFFTTKPPGEGTGLGLYISRKIIHEHHGEIFIDNNCINTRFVIKLPRY